jgi:DNA polymerase-3 subunit gamma/tau
VDEVQSLLEQAVYKPVQGRFKVFMIDEVHMLTNTAFNAMLKTLEEPPEYLKFVLATTDPQKVPVTVLSRCLQFNLRPMAPETVREHLTRVLQAEGVNADDSSLRLLARAARGSMRDALSLTDQAIAFGAGQLQEATVRQMLGSVDRSHVVRLIDALARGDGKTVVETSEQLRLYGLSAASTLEEMSSTLQRMAVLQAVPDIATQDADPDAADTARLAAAMPADETQLLYSMCLHGRAELGLAPDEYAALTMVLLRLLAFKPGRAAASAEKKTPDGAGRVVTAAASDAVAASASASAAAPVAPRPAVAPPAQAPREALAAAAAETAPLPASSGDMANEVAMASARPGAALAAAEPARTTVMPARAAPSSNNSAPYTNGSLPQGEHLRVVDMPEVRLQPSNAPEPEPPSDSGVVAVPVRQQPEPGGRGQPRTDSSGRLPPATFVATEEGDFWHQVVQQLIAAEAISALARELALQSQLVARDIDHWMLRVERESINQPAAREKLRNALASIGQGVRLSVEVGTVSDSPARRNAAYAAEKQRAAEEIVLNDSFVQSMARDFGAKIVASGIKPL